MVSCSCNEINWFDAPLGTGDWCDHWKQCVWFVPGNGLSICNGEEVVLHAAHTETSISYNLKSLVLGTEVRQCDVNVEDFHLILPPERIGIYGDGEWRLSMFTAIRNAVRSLSLSLSFPLLVCICTLNHQTHFFIQVHGNLSRLSSKIWATYSF